MVMVAHKYMPDEVPEDELKATFAARHHTLDYLKKSLRDQIKAQTLTSYLITGPRGAGKTTLIRMLCFSLYEDPELKTAWLPVRFPEELPTVTCLRDLLAKALDILADQGITEARHWYERVEQEDNEAASQDLAIAGLRQIAIEQDKRLILFVENLNMVFERGLTDDTKATLRRLLMTEPFMMLVGSAVRIFPEIRSYDEAFFNYFCPVELETLNAQQASEILRQRAAWDGNTRFERQYQKHRAKIRAISLLTGGNPRLLLMLYEILAQQDISSAVQALRSLVDELTPLLKDVLEHQLTKQQVKIVDALMQCNGKAQPKQIAKQSRLDLNTVTSQLKRLTEAKILEVQGSGKGRPAWYTVPDRLFYTWYQMRYLRPQRRRIEMFVRVLQIWFEAEERFRVLHSLFKNIKINGAKQAGIVAETAEYFAASLKETEHQSPAQELAIRAWLDAGQMEQAAGLVAEFQQETDKTGLGKKYVSYSGLSRWLWEHGDLPKAIQLAKEHLDEDPDNIDLILDYGTAIGMSGDYTGALNCFDQVVKSMNVNVQQKAYALYNGGVIKGKQGDTAGAIMDYSLVISLKEASMDHIARALNNRGVMKGREGDVEGQVADYTSVINLKGAPMDYIARALNNRGVVKTQEGDIIGAIADYTSVINLKGASMDMIAQALYNRGVTMGRQGDITGARKDLSAVIDLEGASVDVRLQAGLVAFNGIYNAEDMRLAVELLSKVREILSCLKVQERAKHILESLAMLASISDPKAWLYAFNHLIKDQPNEVTKALESLYPIAEVLDTGDKSRLDPLPPEQRDFALEVLRKFEKTESQSEE